MFSDGNEGSIADDENMIIKEVLRVTHFFNFLKFNFGQFHMFMHIDINYIYMYIFDMYMYTVYSDYCHPSSFLHFHPITHSLVSLFTELN